MGKKLPERNIIGKLMAFAAAAALCASLAKRVSIIPIPTNANTSSTMNAGSQALYAGWH